VEDLARQRLSLSQRDAAEHNHPSPWSDRRMFGRGTGRSYSPANRCLPPSRGGLPQVMGAIALCWRSREPPPCATGDARERLARAASLAATLSSHMDPEDLREVISSYQKCVAEIVRRNLPWLFTATFVTLIIAQYTRRRAELKRLRFCPLYLRALPQDASRALADWDLRLFSVEISEMGRQARAVVDRLCCKSPVESNAYVPRPGTAQGR
jgi:hypothetical protein